MRRQHNDTALQDARVPQQVPHRTPRLNVHACGRLVQEHQLRSTDEGTGNGELPLLTTRQNLAPAVLLLVQVHKLQHLGGPCLEHLSRHTLNASVEHQVLFAGQRSPQDVVLRAESDALTNDVHVAQNALTPDLAVARDRRQHAGHHVDQRRLSRTVVPQHALHLALVERQRVFAAGRSLRNAVSEVVHGHVLFAVLRRTLELDAESLDAHRLARRKLLPGRLVDLGVNVVGRARRRRDVVHVRVAVLASLREAPVRRVQEEQRVQLHAVLRRQHVVQVQGEDQVEEGVEDHHEHAEGKRVLVGSEVGEVGSRALLLVVHDKVNAVPKGHRRRQRRHGLRTQRCILRDVELGDRHSERNQRRDRCGNTRLREEDSQQQRHTDQTEREQLKQDEEQESARVAEVRDRREEGHQKCRDREDGGVAAEPRGVERTLGQTHDEHPLTQPVLLLLDNASHKARDRVKEGKHEHKRNLRTRGSVEAAVQVALRRHRNEDVLVLGGRRLVVLLLQEVRVDDALQRREARVRVLARAVLAQAVRELVLLLERVRGGGVVHPHRVVVDVGGRVHLVQDNNSPGVRCATVLVLHVVDSGVLVRPHVGATRVATVDSRVEHQVEELCVRTHVRLQSSRVLALTNKLEVSPALQRVRSAVGVHVEVAGKVVHNAVDGDHVVEPGNGQTNVHRVQLGKQIASGLDTGLRRHTAHELSVTRDVRRPELHVAATVRGGPRALLQPRRRSLLRGRRANCAEGILRVVRDVEERFLVVAGVAVAGVRAEVVADHEGADHDGRQQHLTQEPLELPRLQPQRLVHGDREVAELPVLELVATQVDLGTLDMKVLVGRRRPSRRRRRRRRRQRSTTSLSHGHGGCVEGGPNAANKREEG
eukprot:Rhum_TRINITY_DN14617_c0_g1::Rhum_TRINITY_DN14617_c0_g1_i1::g.105109::m.105109